MRRNDWVLIGSGLALLASAALLRAAPVVNVTQAHRAFSVAEVTLHRGDTVRFTNEDVFNHQIYVKSPSFTYDSDEQAPGDVVQFPFTQAGVFDVQCSIHPRMHLAVTVE